MKKLALAFMFLLSACGKQVAPPNVTSVGGESVCTKHVAVGVWENKPGFSVLGIRPNCTGQFYLAGGSGCTIDFTWDTKNTGIVGVIKVTPTKITGDSSCQNLLHSDTDCRYAVSDTTLTFNCGGSDVIYTKYTSGD